MYGPPHASMNDPTTTTTTANVQPHHHHLHHHHHHPHPHPHSHGTTHLNDDDNDDDVVDCSNGNDSMDNPQSQIRYDPSNPSHSPHALAGGTVLDSVVPALYASDIPTAPAPSSGEAGADQLTLSFQGEVYVFDSVSPEKVQAVLLLLGGYEVPTGIPTAGMTPQGHRNLGDYPGRSSQPQRAASLNRFREKRKERCFDKKIRYTVRKEVALRMQRKKGQFTSSKSISEEPGSSAADGNGSSGQEEQETLCRHCGISSKATPMMRRGPDGPRTLCNACGLKWANKGILRDLSKVPLPMIAVQTNVMKAIEPSSEAKVEGTAIPPSNVIMTSSGDN